MGQAEIIEVLEKAKLPMCGREIAEALGVSFRDNLNKHLRKLLEHKEIKCIEINRHKALKHFGSKRKLRLYYLSTFNKGYLRRAKDTLSCLQ